MNIKTTFQKVSGLIKSALIISVICFAPLFSSAQGGGEEGLPCDGTDIDLECPLDGGVIALLAAGAFFGIKKLAVK